MFKLQDTSSLSAYGIYSNRMFEYSVTQALVCFKQITVINRVFSIGILDVSRWDAGIKLRIKLIKESYVDSKPEFSSPRCRFDLVSTMADDELWRSRGHHVAIDCAAFRDLDNADLMSSISDAYLPALLNSHGEVAMKFGFFLLSGIERR
jgi:hypothetical protein